MREANFRAGSPLSSPGVPLEDLLEELDRHRMIVAALLFDPIPGGVKTRADALHILGFPPDATPDLRTVRAKYRLLAVIHHPDGAFGSHQRMSQVNQAMQTLLGSVLVGVFPGARSC